MIPDWPLLLQPRAVTAPVLHAASRKGPQPLAGAPVSIVSPSAHWRMGYAQVRAALDLQLAFQALFGDNGGATVNPVMVSPWQFRLSPRARAGLPVRILATHDDGALFSDGAGYYSTPTDFLVHAAAAARAAALVVEMLTPGVAFTAGQFFTLGAGDLRRMYRVVRAWPVDGSPTLQALDIAPPLRAAVAAGAEVESQDPRFPALVEGDEPALSIDLGIVGYADLNFIEYPW